MRLLVIVATALALLWHAPARADESAFDPERLKLAREMLQLSGMEALSSQMLELVSRHVSELVRRHNPDQGEVISEIIETVLVPEAKRRAPEMSEAMARLYAERFTAPELQDVVDFYRTPTGRKLVAASPELLSEGNRLGQAWGRLIVEESWPRLVERLREKGLKPPPAI